MYNTIIVIIKTKDWFNIDQKNRLKLDSIVIIGTNKNVNISNKKKDIH